MFPAKFEYFLLLTIVSPPTSQNFPSWFCCQVCFVAQICLKCFFSEVVFIMQISVKNQMGNIVIRPEVVSSDTIVDIKAKIQEYEGILPA